jgi:hypothetical protein
MLINCACCQMAWPWLMPNCRERVRELEQLCYLPGEYGVHVVDGRIGIGQCLPGTPSYHLFDWFDGQSRDHYEKRVLTKRIFDDAQRWAQNSTWAEIESACCVAVRDVVHDPFAAPKDCVCFAKEWLTRDVIALARAACEERPEARKCEGCDGSGSVCDIGRHAGGVRAGRVSCMRCRGSGCVGAVCDPVMLSLLADALEDAGCGDAAVLSHCRGEGPHYLGCWVLDGLLAPE